MYHFVQNCAFNLSLKITVEDYIINEQFDVGLYV